MSKILLIGAMPQEIGAYRSQIRNNRWNGHHVIVEEIGVGKTSAALYTQAYIHRHSPDYVLATGVGGALDEKLAIGDIGIVAAAIDAEMDVRAWNPSFERGQIPFVTHGRPDRAFASSTNLCGSALLYGNAHPELRTFVAYNATVSQFMTADQKRRFNEQSHELSASVGGCLRTPNVVDMETSAILQTTNWNYVPALVIRAVSDTLTGEAPADFNRFVENNVEHYVPLVDYVLQNIQ